MRINGRFMNFRYLFQLRKRFESKSELSLPNFRFRLYSSEVEPEISPDLLNIMEQRFSAIKHRATCLDNLINQTARNVTVRVCKS